MVDDAVSPPFLISGITCCPDVSKTLHRPINENGFHRTLCLSGTKPGIPAILAIGTLKSRSASSTRATGVLAGSNALQLLSSFFRPLLFSQSEIEGEVATEGVLTWSCVRPSL